MNKNGISFVASHIDVEGELPLELLPNYVFRKANDDEIDIVRKKIFNSIPAGGFVRQLPYEYIVREEIHERQTSFHYDPIPKEKWKYWVIGFEGHGNEIQEIKKSASLLPFDLELAFETGNIIHGEEKTQGTWSNQIPLNIIEYLSDHEFASKNAKKITSKELLKIKEYHDLIMDLNDDYGFVKHALENFMDLKRIPKNSDMLVVGYFSIIESLVTHAPRLTETLDSISHQLKNKMIMLQKKYDNPIITDIYFKNIKTDKALAKLYSYRSAIAHGSKVDLTRGPLEVLKSKDNVLSYLKHNVKELIIIALRNPDFMSDLKKC